MTAPVLATNAVTATDLYLLAHPDDDLFVRPLFRARDVHHRVVYLTNGRVPGPVTPEQRRAEAKAALNAVGVDDVAWVGIERDIDVYALVHRLADAWAGLESATSGTPIRRIVTHAWEGGHPDHDAAHLLARRLADRLGVSEKSITLPYYRAPVRGPVPFLVMAPLAGNGDVEAIRLSWRDALDMMGGARWYPSQKVPLVGLAPGLVLEGLIRRRLRAQPLSASRCPERPAPGKLLYERRNGITYAEFRARADAFAAA